MVNTLNKFSKPGLRKELGGGKTPSRIKRITSWSFSRLKLWEDCPQAAKFKFIEKLGDETKKAPAMIRGDAIHKMAEDYCRGKLKKLPKELSNFGDSFKELKGAKPILEEMWCFTKDWAETRWDDWNNVWLRVKTDAAALDGTELDIIDHKTGKNRGGYKSQMDLSALAGMLKFPSVKIVRTHLWFLDSGDVVSDDYKVKDRPKMQEYWEGRTAPMLADTEFKPKPSREACQWCEFHAKKGGPCKVGV